MLCVFSLSSILPVIVLFFLPTAQGNRQRECASSRLFLLILNLCILILYVHNFMSNFHLHLISKESKILQTNISVLSIETTNTEYLAFPSHIYTRVRNRFVVTLFWAKHVPILNCQYNFELCVRPIKISLIKQLTLTQICALN